MTNLRNFADSMRTNIGYPNSIISIYTNTRRTTTNLDGIYNKIIIDLGYSTASIVCYIDRAIIGAANPPRRFTNRNGRSFISTTINLCNVITSKIRNVEISIMRFADTNRTFSYIDVALQYTIFEH